MRAREYFPNQTHQDSIAWAILPYHNDSGAFSKGGDSSWSMIVSGTGEVDDWPFYWRVWKDGVVRYTGYATPMFWLWHIIKSQFPDANPHSVFNWVRLFSSVSSSRTDNSRH
jgi:hypothetical protein